MAQMSLGQIRERLLGSSQVAVWLTESIKGQAELEIGVLFGYDGDIRCSRLEIDREVGAKRVSPEVVSNRHLRSIVRRAELTFTAPANAPGRIEIPGFVTESVTSRVSSATAAGD